MEKREDEFINELENRIETNLAKLTLAELQRTKQRPSAMVTNPNDIPNSQAPINMLSTDVLYKIFTMAIDSPDYGEMPTLTISHVCHHWRKCTLDWPTLWAFVDFSTPDEIVRLYVDRSKNSPIALSCDVPSSFDPDLFLEVSWIFPRLCSLVIYLPCSEYVETLHVFKCLELSDQLRDLEVGLYLDLPINLLGSTDFPPVDISRLTKLKVSNMSMPSPKLPHDKLTSFTFHGASTTSPNFQDLVDFLSKCPLLEELDLIISEDDCDVTAFHPNDKLDLVNLKILKLKSLNMKSHAFMQRLMTCIRNLESLVELQLSFVQIFQEPPREVCAGPFNDLESVPLAMFSRFTNHHFLHLVIEKNDGRFVILSKPDHSSKSKDQLLQVIGALAKGTLLNYAPFLNFIRVMRAVTYLSLSGHAWEILSSWNVDILNIFPSLDTLELSDPAVGVTTTQVLNSLQTNLKLKTLVIGKAGDLSPKALLDAVFRTGATILKLDQKYYEDSVRYGKTLAALREKGVVVHVAAFPDDDDPPDMWEL